MLKNDFDDLSCNYMKLSDFTYFNLGQENGGSEIVSVTEYENKSDAWRHLGHETDLLVVIFSDCTVMIYDRLNNDGLKTINVLPAFFA